jgi:hypothetical protein
VLLTPLSVALALAVAQPSLQPPEPAPEPGVGREGSPWTSSLLFASGALAAFVSHEGGHVAANLALGSPPHLESVSFAGVIPFFSITSDITCNGDRCSRPVDGGTTPFGPGRRGLFTILMAGFHAQHVGDELILSLDPALRYHDAPFRKGMLAFNTLTSVGYVLANWVGVEPEKGDLHGAYVETGAPRHVVNAILIGVAVLDMARYAFPDARWLAWVSRAGKVGLAGLTFSL